jgi:small subunit ribosomal protein S8
MNIVANLSNCIKNAQSKYKHFIKYHISKFSLNLITLLFQENIIRGFFFEKAAKNFVVLLKYESIKKGFKKIAFKPKKAINFKPYKIVAKYHNGLGLYIVSTSKGVMTNRVSYQLKLGGILIMSVY